MPANVNTATRQLARVWDVQRVTPATTAPAVTMRAKAAMRTVTVARTIAALALAAMPTIPVLITQVAARRLRCAAVPVAVPRAKPASVARVVPVTRCATASAALRARRASMERAVPRLKSATALAVPPIKPVSTTRVAAPLCRSAALPVAVQRARPASAAPAVPPRTSAVSSVWLLRATPPIARIATRQPALVWVVHQVTPVKTVCAATIRV